MCDCNNATSGPSFLVAMLIVLLLSPAVHAGETRIIKDKGIEIEAFVFGKGYQTLIIAAGKGRPAADLEHLAKERPNTWLVGIPSCGHNMVFEQPEALMQLIIEFIQSVIARH